MPILSKEERESVVLEAIERALLLIPSVVGNMMASQSALMAINKKFYSDYPEFKGHKDSVMSAVEQIEGKNPLMDHKDILEKAVPEIRKRIDTLKRLDLDTVSANPPRQFESIDSPSDKNPHGVI